MKKILSLLAVMLLAVAGMYGQSPAPGILNYQGVARNSVGNVLVNKSITLRLTIRDGSAAGPVVYQESRGVTTNPFGLFNVQLGSSGAANVTGSIASVPWGVGLKFIQVEIDPNGGSTFINIGTAQLASVPYSLYASTANDLVLPFNKTQADAGTLFRITNSGNNSGSRALEGLTNSTQANAFAIAGTVTSTAPGGFSAGVRGINNGTGGLGIGVWGSQDGSGWGVYGTAVSGFGVNGVSNSGDGVHGVSTSGFGVSGITSATNGAGVLGDGTGTGSSMGVIGRTGEGSYPGLLGNAGVAGRANANIGVAGSALSGTGGRFTSQTGLALHTTGNVRLQGIGEANNYILRSDVSGNATWANPAVLLGPLFWSTTGNAGTVDGTNFIGTTDNVPFNFRVNNQRAGKLETNNTSLGYLSHNNNPTGLGNTAIGSSASQALTTGVNNTVVGRNAMGANSTTSANTAMGFNILPNMTGGGSVTAIGYASMQSTTTGFRNTGLGDFSLTNATISSGNVAIGSNTLAGVTTGANNTGLGFNANVSGGTTSNATAIGANAQASADNSLVLGSINGVNGATADVNVGIGLTAPTARLHVSNAGAGPLTTLQVQQTNTANTANAAQIFNLNTSTTGFGNGALYAQRGGAAGTYFTLAGATGITSLGATPGGIGVQGSTDGGAGVVGLANTGIGVRGFNVGSNSAARFENAITTTNAAPVVVVNNISTAGGAFGVHSIIAPAAPGGFSTALRGQNNGTAGLGIGVWGSQNGSGWGVYGTAPSGLGVYGSTVDGNGVRAEATNNGFGVVATALNGMGTYSFSQNWYGVWGETNSSNGVNTAGTLGYASNATSTNFTRGFWGYNNATNNDGAGGLFQHVSGGYGVYGTAGAAGTGVYGAAGADGTGVFGEANGAAARGVRGQSDLGNAGYFETTDATSQNATVRVADPNVTTGGNFFRKAGIYSELTPISGGTSLYVSPTAIKGVSSASNTVGFAGGTGVQGASRSGYGVIGITFNGVGLHGRALDASGYALQTIGRVMINGQGAAANRILTSTNANGDAVWNDPSAVGIVSGSGTLNYVPKWTPDGTTLGNSLIFDDGAGVGIGTTTPTAFAEISGNSAVGTPQLKLTETGNDYSRMTLRNIHANNAGNNFWDIAGYNNDTRANERLNFYNASTGDLMTIAGDGRVGIGIQANYPAAKLHVENQGTGFPGFLVNHPNETLIPAAKVLGDGVVTDLSLFAPGAGQSTVFIQREDYAATIAYFAVPRAFAAYAPSGNNVVAVQGSSNGGHGVAGITYNGSGLRGVRMPTGTGNALYTSGGGVRLADIGEANGYVLTSDAVGNATWQENTSQSVGITMRAFTANLSIPSGINTPITQWLVVDNEDGGANYNNVTGEYTITRTGTYQVNASVLWDAFSASGRTLLGLYINGNFYTETGRNATAGGSFHSDELSAAVRLTAGDLVSFRLYQATGVNQNLTGNLGGHAFSVQFLHR